MALVGSSSRALENYLSDPAKTNVESNTPSIASKVLTYLIKGIASDVKEAVAHYAVDKFTKENLYRWTWEVITKLERAGIAIIAFTSDGGSSNRSFMKMNKPASEGEFIYDTINKTVPDRKLYFIADVPHLLKTIRNCCFYSSCEKRYHNQQTGKMMLKRRLEKNGEKILWSTIINVYNEEVNKTLRLCPKLNVQNVFLNSYSKMKVKYAAQVMSRSVAQLIEDMKLPNTKETVEFIRRTNDFFDMLNGAHTQQGVRSRNDNLLPYRSVTDERFAKLEDFLSYLKDWQNDAECKAANVTVDVSWQGRPGNEESICGDDLDEPDLEEDSDPASIRQLSKPTLEGIYVTVKGFTGAAQFLLESGVNSLMQECSARTPWNSFSANKGLNVEAVPIQILISFETMHGQSANRDSSAAKRAVRETLRWKIPP
ncbi:Transposable element P transposase [Frankliniella fusca]|uniref:Transposable element P transposase n=1 Tax=Frankliniella fusca TaxID=407009 RepID=A0AAE1HEY0_9NEOP|nr:Transposable element P transposase [Frankliniella fusca]